MELIFAQTAFLEAPFFEAASCEAATLDSLQRASSTNKRKLNPIGSLLNWHAAGRS